jgi:hypothetical protein
MTLGITACLDQPTISEQQQDERIEVHGCRPGLVQIGDECIDPAPGGGGAGGGSGGEREPRGPGTGGGGGTGHTMDPEPDRNKDRKSCFDWCSWDWRQCIKECDHMYPDPRWNERNRCKRSCDQKVNSCTADCNVRFPERPLVTVEPST